MKPLSQLFSVLTISTALALTACGGGGGGSNKGGGSSGGSSVTKETGVLSDAAVAGVAYKTSPSGQTGTTNTNGEYEYVAGDTVTFTVAGLELPPVTATGRITPQTIADEVFSETAKNSALNLAILFQALDEDGDPSNGITVLEETELSESISVESLVESTPQVFATALQSEDLPENAVVPDPVAALEHFYTTELAGNWRWVGGSNDSDIFVTIDGAGHVLWVEYDIQGSPATCSVFDSGYSAIYTGALAFDETDLSVSFASNGRELMTGCAEGSTDHVADMFDGEIALVGEQLVITREDGGSSATFNRFSNVKGSPVGVWQEDATPNVDGSLDFGGDINGLFSLVTENRHIQVVLDRAASGTDCEYNGVYVAGYSFDEDEHVIAIGNEYLNHVWLNPENCDKAVPANDWEFPVSASVLNDSIWEVDSEEFALARNLSAAERTGAFNSTVNADDLIGSWRMDNDASAPDDVTLHILNFLNDGKYVQGLIHKDMNDGAFCGHGLEYGAFTLDGNWLAVQAENDTMPDISCGFTGDSFEDGFEIARLSGDKLVLAVENGWYYLEFNRVKNNNLRGSWVLTQSAYLNDGTVLSLLDDGYYLQMQPVIASGDDDSWDGVEYGRYTLNNGVLTVTQVIEDTNGHSGLGLGSMTLAIDNDGFLRFDNDDGCFGFKRIENAEGSLAALGDCPDESDIGNGNGDSGSDGGTTPLSTRFKGTATFTDGSKTGEVHESDLDVFCEYPYAAGSYPIEITLNAGEISFTAYFDDFDFVGIYDPETGILSFSGGEGPQPNDEEPGFSSSWSMEFSGTVSGDNIAGTWVDVKNVHWAGNEAHGPATATCQSNVSFELAAIQ